MLRPCRACRRKLVLDFLPGANIVVPLKDSVGEMVNGLESLERRAVDHSPERDSFRDNPDDMMFKKHLRNDIASRMQVFGDELSVGPGDTWKMSSISSLRSSSQPSSMGDCSREMGLLHKSILHPTSTSLATFSSVVANLRAARTYTLHRLLHAQPTWQLRKRRRRPPSPLGLKLWSFTPRAGDIDNLKEWTMQESQRWIDEHHAGLAVWINHGSLMRKRRQVRINTCRAKRRALRAPLAVWHFHADTAAPESYDVLVRRAGPTASMDALLRAGGKPHQILMDLTRRRVKLQDGGLASLLTAVGPVKDELQKTVRGSAHLRTLQQLYECMCKRHAPGKLTHSKAVHLLARSGNTVGAHGLLVRLLNSGFQPDTQVFAHILFARETPNILRDDLLERMRQCGVSLDAECWAALVLNDGRKNFAGAVTTYRASLAYEVEEGSRLTYSAWTYRQLMKLAPPAAGYAIWAEMRRRKVRPTADVLCEWLERCCAFGDVDTAVAASFVAAEDGVSASDTLISVAVRCGEFPLISELLLPLHVASRNTLSESLLFDVLQSQSADEPLYTDSPAALPSSSTLPWYGLGPLPTEDHDCST